MLVDCFPFFNELELLSLRLEELRHVVDRFVLVEARETFSGRPKTTYFEDNQNLFAHYPIHHAVIDKFPASCVDAWQRDRFQRDAISTFLGELQMQPNDLVMVSDADEIPRREAVLAAAAHIHDHPTHRVAFSQTMYYYYLNCMVMTPWCGTRMARFANVGSAHDLRVGDGTVLREGGWHFSYLGGIAAIQQKVASYAHQELDRPPYTDAAHIAACLRDGKDLFGRDVALRFVPLDASYPDTVLRNRKRFSHLLRAEYSSPTLEHLYDRAALVPSDINEHIPFLRRLASTVRHVTEFGTRYGNSTAAFLAARPQRVVCYDRHRQPVATLLEEAAQSAAVAFLFHERDVLDIVIDNTDLLFIDTWHVEGQLRAELALHEKQVRQYIVLHDTETFRYRGETIGHRGLWYAVEEFLNAHPEWRLAEHFLNNNGLTVIRRAEREPQGF